ncbi:MAG: eCIS core domain-containing protein, partial [Pyrinomonadaceae bacterium]
MNARVQTKSDPSPAISSASGGLLQRKCACGGGAAGLSGDCEECSRKRLQRKPAGMEETDTIPPIVHEVLRSSGEPLDAATRTLMESRFGHDFSRVRTHRDARAAESARAVNALAYTVGQDVVFGAGQYAPETMGGRKLVAHELAHVVQQRNATYPVGGL